MSGQERVAMVDEAFKELARALIHTAQSAGELILRYRNSGQEVTYKDDGSPVTVADRAAEELIINDLARLAPGVVAIGEESVGVTLADFDPDKPFFLVDPLDGTRGFVKGGDEFSVNIGLVRDRTPVFGLIYAPALEKLYLTVAPGEAASARLVPARGQNLDDLSFTPLHVRTSVGKLTAVASRSHMNDATRDYMARLPIAETLSVSSSLKFAVVAEGGADLYPRLAPTCEWDTAAGQAILTAAGGKVLAEDGNPLAYGKVAADLVNPGFVAWGGALATLDPAMVKV
jgi:3'(2'), 5'-bisphosphate nucleotidase